MAGTQRTTLGALGGGADLAAAANIIASAARANASWSDQISADINVDVTGDLATVWSEAPPAYTAEVQARHPLFGDTSWWYPPSASQVPFLGPAADAKAGAAMARYARKLDRMLSKAGFR